LYFPDIFRVLKSGRMRGVGHVAGTVGNKNSYRILVGKTGEKSGIISRGMDYGIILT
jgi:hypothetical protein